MAIGPRTLLLLGAISLTLYFVTQYILNKNKQKIDLKIRQKEVDDLLADLDNQKKIAEQLKEELKKRGIKK